MLTSGDLECRRVSSDVEPLLSQFFVALRANGDEKHFHPHALTPEEAHRVAHYGGSDLYYVVREGETILAYGMLRGWDAGFEIPSLGIAVHPDYRRLGLGRLLMDWLHVVAKRRGARRVRLTADADNDRAVRIYELLGYRLEPDLNGRLVGYRDL